MFTWCGANGAPRPLPRHPEMESSWDELLSRSPHFRCHVHFKTRVIFAHSRASSDRTRLGLRREALTRSASDNEDEDVSRPALSAVRSVPRQDDDSSKRIAVSRGKALVTGGQA